MRPEQLLLNVRPRVDVALEDFRDGSFAPIRAALEQLLSGQLPSCFLYGPAGSGKHALLSALAGRGEQTGRALMLLPLAEVASLGPDMLAGLEGFELLVLEGLEAVAGSPDWEEGLFHLINRLQASGSAWVATADRAVPDLDIRLPDLRSRLRQAPAFALPLPDDDSRERLLLSSARRMGLVLETDVARYLVERGPRFLGSFLDCIEGLDRETLQTQRRLTVPFVREVLARQGLQTP